MDKLSLSEGQKVLLLWKEGAQPEQLQQTVTELRSKVGEKGSVKLENVDRLLMCKY